MTVAVSVVIPAYEAAATIGIQLRSIISGTARSDYEIIVVDNRSTDDLADVVAAIGDNRIRVVAASELPGPSYARNVGVEAATGAVLAFCDADDQTLPGWLDNITMPVSGGTAAIVTGGLRASALNDPILSTSRGSYATASTFYDLFPTISAGNFACSRGAWDDVGGFDEALTAFEDADWSMRATDLGLEIRFEPTALVDYRYRANARELWTQGLRYGQHRPLLAKRWHRDHGTRPSRIAGLRSWAWLMVHLYELLSSARRPRLAWVAGNRIGGLLGSLRHRFLLL